MTDGFALLPVGGHVFAYLHLNTTVRLVLGVEAETIAAIAFGVIGYFKAAHVAAFKQLLGEGVEQKFNITDTVDVIVLVDIAEVSGAPAAGCCFLAHPNAAEGLVDAGALRVDVGVKLIAEEAF